MPEFGEGNHNIRGFEVEEGDCPLFPIILKFTDGRPSIELRILFIEQTVSVGIALVIDEENLLINMEPAAAIHFGEHLAAAIDRAIDTLNRRENN